MQVVSDVIGLWPTPSVFADDIDVSIGTVRVWKHRRSIPSDYWSAVEEAARRRSIKGATASDLAKLAAVGRPKRPAPSPEAAV